MSGSESLKVAGVDGCKGGWAVANVVVAPETTGRDSDIDIRRFGKGKGF